LRRANVAGRAVADPDALHAVAIAELLLGAGSGKSVQRSISLLQSAARLSDRPTPVLADLAAAHLMWAGRNGAPADLLAALEASTTALALEPDYAAAQFNAAEALDRLGLRRQATRAWSRYLATDSTSAWATEARRRLRRRMQPRLVSEPAHSAPPAAMGEYAMKAPREARELGWDQLMGEWGQATLGGDAVRAAQRLAQAAAIGAALARSGDASLADDVAEIRQHLRDPATTRRFAAAHREFATARRAYLATDYEAACPAMERAGLTGSPATLRQWARTFGAICLHYQQRSSAAARALRALAEQADSVRYPALAGRSWWALGAVLLSLGRYEEALAPLEQAHSLMQRAGEDENVGGVLSHLGQARLQLGDAEGGYAALHRAVVVLGRRPASLQLHNVLYALGNAAAADGWTEAALRVRDESVAVAEEMARPQYVVEARLARARLRLAAGRAGGAEDVAEATRIMDAVQVRFPRRWLSADLREASAAALVGEQPARAAAELDSVAAFFAAQDFPERLVPALLAAAEAKLALRRSRDAAADLRRATGALDTLRAHVTHASLRASLLEGSRRVFDRAVMLSLAEGRPREALDYVERSRASFSPVGHAPDWARRPLRAPTAHVALEFALVGDTLLAWTLGPHGAALTRTLVRRDALVHDVEQVRSALERRAPAGTVLPSLERLHDRLLRPLQDRLGPPETPLMIVADGELAAIPFAALRDREQNRYLVEDHPIRFASSLRDPVGPRAATPSGMPTTVVADPAIDPGAFPELQPLTGAFREAATVANTYPGARVLAGRAASAAALRAAFERGGIAHFAGHAVFDDARPERSFLVVAGRGRGPSSRLTAAEIERMDLRRLRLVVLSACQTARAQAGRSGGFAGLAGAFLAAGAGGVVGSLWQVDDGNTRALMERFHEEYLRSGDGAEALRQAQLSMLHSGDAELRAPSAWAGFRYAGN
jgi:CHAT domain-containing protein/tetratricopeptide (TPR) repeat protein